MWEYNIVKWWVEKKVKWGHVAYSNKYILCSHSINNIQRPLELDLFTLILLDHHLFAYKVKCTWKSDIFAYKSCCFVYIYVCVCVCVCIGVWFLHCHLEVHTTWGLKMAFLVENGFGPNESLPPPPWDLPRC